ncbi:MarR family transcriptional regulator [Lentibacillus salicampi]|uniref:MarR family transcriptional regulator n=1 Tax=Lentibacillus salicampi TaxID=175306 RepID=A0A4Y9A7N5_9BACI|nr:MarR family winged helix-turn-helix transcriptional regulator [Lentibacillus salicampi]TFJ91212.1 MarR family transcriptional regulator [Lentibacillus salicampi]
MDDKLKDLDLIDVLSERHLQLRKVIEQLWNTNSDMNLSNSEWFMMARIYQKQPTIAYVSRNVDISRQATHKLIKKLEEKGLVEVSNVRDNKKDKYIRLTDLGEACYEKNEALKADQERKIADNIGHEQFQLLNDILKADWGM